MPLNISSRNTLKKYAALLVLLAVAVTAGAQDNNKKQSPPPPAPPPPQRSAPPPSQRPATPPQQQPPSQRPTTPPQQRPPTQHQRPSTLPQQRPPVQQQRPATPPAQRPATPQPQRPAPPTQQPNPQRIDGNKSSVKPAAEVPPKLLSSKDSDHQIKNLNKDREKLAGINRNALPKGQVTVHPDGHQTIADHKGRQYDLRADGTVSKVALKDGRSATYRPDGSVGSVQANGMEIRHNTHGGRTIVAERPDHTRLVSTGPHYGYVERPVTRNGRDYIQRTYSERGVTYSRVYRTYTYNSVVYARYVPAYYYAPKFYGWVYYPWGSPIVYQWGWSSAPWYQHYGAYLSPYPAYSSPDLWLTDFVLAANLQSSYQQSVDAGDSGLTESDFSTPISPEIKNELAKEIKQEVSAEHNEAVSSRTQPSSPGDLAPSVLDPQWKVFIVSSTIETQGTDGTPCELAVGDILQLDTPVHDGASDTKIRVVSSKQKDCSAGQQVTVPIQDLEEMHNQFRAHADDGIKTLAADQGKKGLPPSPPPNPYSSDAPSDTKDTDVNAALDQQQQQADQVEAQVEQEAFRK
jgi:hypothetical protein